MTRVLLLGADGYLGSAVWRRFGFDGHTVVAHLRRPPTRRDALRSEAVEALDLATATLAELRDLVERSDADVVVNCVGAISGSARELSTANLLVVERVLRVVGRVAGTRFVQIGSAAEYGLTERGRPTKETDVCAPTGDYGLSKLAATCLVQERAIDERFPAVVLRVFNPVGRGASPVSLPGRVAAEIRRALVTREPVIELGPLDSWRDFVGLDDVAAAVVAASTDADSEPGARIYNVGSGTAVCARTLVEALVDVAGYRGRIVESAPRSSRSGRVDWQQADITALGERYGLRPAQSLDDMVADLWHGVPVGV